MARRTLKGGLIGLIAGVVLATGPSSPALAEEPPPIRIGWTPWSSAEAVINIARLVLEDRMGYEVEPVMTNIGVQY